jgi:23S rRNA pseudouridine1911/1915/1917 synthase
MSLKFVIADDVPRDRLDRVLAAVWGESRGTARRAIDAGGVYVLGKRCRSASRSVGPGVEIEVEPRAAEVADWAKKSLAANPPVLVYRDAHIVVVNKPPGVPVSPTRETVHGTVESWLTEQGFTYVALHHRLDRDAQGLLVVAIHRAANKGLARAFQQRRVRRTYRAVLVGGLQGEGTWKNTLVQRRGKRVAVAPNKKGQSMRATWSTLARRGANTLVRVVLETGRTHQIRLQSVAAGHPVLGDRIYGGSQPGGLRLQASRLELKHPVSGKPLLVELDEPTSWRGEDDAHDHVAPDPGDQRGAAEEGPEG